MGTIRRLVSDDLDDLLCLFGPNSPPAQTLLRELSRHDVYFWLGLFAQDGKLVATHRAMTLGGVLLLKGVSVSSPHRGSTAAVRLSMAMLESAEKAGCDGVAAWIEPTQPERFLAARLAIRGAGPLIHRFLLPLVDSDQDGDARSGANLNGALQVDLQGAAMVPDLLGGLPGTVNWVIDGRRLVLSGNPCCTTAELPQLLERARPLALAAGANGVEVPVPAADLAAAFSIVRPGVTRLSRTPVLMGMRRLGQTTRVCELDEARA